jgi:hypothetical protein
MVEVNSSLPAVSGASADRKVALQDGDDVPQPPRASSPPQAQVPSGHAVARLQAAEPRGALAEVPDDRLEEIAAESVHCTVPLPGRLALARTTLESLMRPGYPGRRADRIELVLAPKTTDHLLASAPNLYCDLAEKNKTPERSAKAVTANWRNLDYVPIGQREAMAPMAQAARQLERESAKKTLAQTRVQHETAVKTLAELQAELRISADGFDIMQLRHDLPAEVFVQLIENHQFLEAACRLDSFALNQLRLLRPDMITAQLCRAAASALGSIPGYAVLGEVPLKWRDEETCRGFCRQDAGNLKFVPRDLPGYETLVRKVVLEWHDDAMKDVPTDLDSGFYKELAIQAVTNWPRDLHRGVAPAFRDEEVCRAAALNANDACLRYLLNFGPTDGDTPIPASVQAIWQAKGIALPDGSTESLGQFRQALKAEPRKESKGS